MSRTALADTAPPLKAPVGSLGVYQYQETQVQMRAERVVLDVQLVETEWSETSQVAVTADFEMYNTGNEAESMQAIFPLTVVDCPMVHIISYLTDPYTFVVYVNGEETPTSEFTTPGEDTWCNPVEWKSFPVSFPPGETVHIRVEYFMAPTGTDAPRPRIGFFYILETGAGWFGTIGQADVILRMPYEITSETLHEVAPGYMIYGDELRWHWENLEPTRDDNISIDVLNARQWLEIMGLREQVEKNPGDVEAWLELARQYDYVSNFHYRDIVDWHFAQLTIEAYNTAIGLQPSAIPIREERLDYIWRMCLSANDWELEADYACVKLVRNEIDSILALDPNNRTVKSYLKDLHELAPETTNSPIPTATLISPASTRTPTPRQTFAKITKTPTLTSSFRVTSTPTSTPPGGAQRPTDSPKTYLAQTPSAGLAQLDTQQPVDSDPTVTPQQYPFEVTRCGASLAGAVLMIVCVLTILVCYRTYLSG